jgi:hypothetical protein
MRFTAEALRFSALWRPLRQVAEPRQSLGLLDAGNSLVAIEELWRQRGEDEVLN